MSGEESWSDRGAAALRRVSRSPTAPLVGLAVAIVAFLVLNLWARQHNYFFYDEYDLVLHRYSLHDLLEPTNGHPVIMWLPIYYLMRPIFGLDSALPYEVVGMLMMVAASCVLFAYLASRAGRWIALTGTVLLLFLGTGADLLFWSFQLAFAGSVGAGLAALLALSSGRRHRDLWAVLLLVASTFFLSVGLAFVVAAAAAALIETGLRPFRPALTRLARVTGPALVLFAIWYLAYGHDSPDRASLDNLIGTPVFVLQGIGASLSYLTGVAATPASARALSWGVPLSVALIGLAVWRSVSGPPLSAAIWIGVAGGLTFWALTGLNRPSGTNADAGRYCFVGAVFALLVVVELVRGLRFRRPLAIAALVSAAVLVSVVGNLNGYRYGRANLVAQAAEGRAVLAALQIARDRVDPKFRPPPETAGTPFLVVLDARSYFKSSERYGSPAWSPSQLLEQPEQARVNADAILLEALPLTLTPAPSAPALACRPVPESGGGGLETGPGELWLRGGAGAPAELQISRFAQAFRPFGTVAPGTTSRLSIPSDRASQPWRLKITGGAARVCGPDE